MSSFALANNEDIPAGSFGAQSPVQKGIFLDPRSSGYD
jgi:hypothetical protein